MKQLNLKLIVTGLLGILFLTSPPLLLAQSGVSGQLVVSGSNFKNQTDFVTVNGESALSGRTVFSPSKIATSPEANAKVILTRLGSTVLFAPGSTMNLSFDNANISGDVSAGSVTIQNIGQTKVNITTPGGAVVFSNQPSSVQIDVTGGATRVCVIDGEGLYNGSRIVPGVNSCGNASTGGSTSPAQSGSAAGGPNYLLFGLLGAAAAAAVVVGLIVANNGGDESSPVSPTR